MPFVSGPLLPSSTISRAACRRYPNNVPRANINDTSDKAREDEIAAKIATLRKYKRLGSKGNPKGNPNTKADQDQDQNQNTDAKKSVPRDADTQNTNVFDELPDWKKEEVLSSQMAEAEAFLNPGSTVNDPSVRIVDKDANNGEKAKDEYSPKVSTWGVFPRPENISRTYGGGRKLPPGGVDLDSPEMKKQDEAVQKSLAAYRAKRGIDMEKENAHRDEIETALRNSERLMKRTLPYDAIDALEPVTEFTSDRSRLGGQVLLALALAYEAVGRREDAKGTYVRLRRSPFTDISSKAKQLLQGFAAMEKLRVGDDTAAEGYRVTRFALPDVNSASDKRYETAVLSEGAGSERPEKLSAGTNFALLALMASPALLIALLVLLRR